MQEQHESFDFSTQLKDILKDICATVFPKKNEHRKYKYLHLGKDKPFFVLKNFIKTDSTKKLYETDAIVFD